jgi:hypothetical protein
VSGRNKTGGKIMFSKFDEIYSYFATNYDSETIEREYIEYLLNEIDELQTKLKGIIEN